MRHVETEACVRQLLKELLDLIGDAPRDLAIVHVLQHEPRTESSVPAYVRKSVRMSHDGPHPQRQPIQHRDGGSFIRLAVLDRRVDAHVSKWHPGPRPQIRDESRKLIARERGELDGEGRDSTRLGDQLRPIAPRRGEHARRDSHGMVRCERARCCGGHVIDRRAHASTVPAAPDVMRSADHDPGGGRSSEAAHRRRSPQPSPNCGSRQRRARQTWRQTNCAERAGSGHHQRAERAPQSAVSTGIWQYRLDPDERPKSGS